MMTLPAYGKQRDHHDRADLDHGVGALGDHQKRFLEFERNDHREDHAKHGLEGHVVGRVEASRENEPEQNLQAQIPNGCNDNDGDQRRKEHDDDLFKPLIKRKQPELFLGDPQPADA